MLLMGRVLLWLIDARSLVDSVSVKRGENGDVFSLARVAIHKGF